MSASVPYSPLAIYDFAVDAENIDSSLTDFYFVVTLISGSVDLFLNSPLEYPAIPTSDNAKYSSVDPSYLYQIIHVSNTDLKEQLRSNNTHKFYRAVVQLSADASFARYSIFVDQNSISDETHTQILLNGIPSITLLTANRSQIFMYHVVHDSNENHHDLTFTLTSIFGHPHTCIKLGSVPQLHSSRHANGCELSCYMYCIVCLMSVL